MAKAGRTCVQCERGAVSGVVGVLMFPLTEPMSKSINDQIINKVIKDKHVTKSEICDKRK